MSSNDWENTELLLCSCGCQSCNFADVTMPYMRLTMLVLSIYFLTLFPALWLFVLELP